MCRRASLGSKPLPPPHRGAGSGTRVRGLATTPDSRDGGSSPCPSRTALALGFTAFGAETPALLSHCLQLLRHRLCLAVLRSLIFAKTDDLKVGATV